MNLNLFSFFSILSWNSLIETHFTEYSRGMPTIPEDSFARLLLRYTSLEEVEVDKYLDRLNSRLRQRKVRIIFGSKIVAFSEKRDLFFYQVIDWLIVSICNFRRALPCSSSSILGCF